MITAIFISRSEGRGHARAQSVLDRYATRIGDATWQTLITQEGLSVLRKNLRKVATRQVAVSCFLKTSRGLSYRWSIGKKVVMQEDGSVPVHHGRVKRRREIPDWLKLACLLNQAAGLAHDFGKASNAFQDKLRQAAENNAIIADPVRHEWISMHMLSAIIRGATWKNAWEEAIQVLQKNAFKLTGTPFSLFKSTPAKIPGNQGIKTKNLHATASYDGHDQPVPAMADWESYLRFIVGSHHRLPQNQNDPYHPERKEGRKGVRPSRFDLNAAEGAHTFFAGQTALKNTPDKSKENPLEFKESVSSCVLNKFHDVARRIEQNVKSMPEAAVKNPDFWLAMAFMSRPAFILADHNRSSVPMPAALKSSSVKKNTQLFANTRIEKGKKNVLNQSLDWHLDAVGSYASKILMEGMVGMDLPSVPKDVVERLAENTLSPQHKWQNESANVLREQHEQHEPHAHEVGEAQTGPVLIFNMAGTGQGKTRMNMRLLATLALRQNKPLRVATMLNLRSLTLQTFDAYEQQLNLDSSLLAGVIGDHVTLQMDKKSGLLEQLEKDDDDQLVADVDGNPSLPEFEAVGSDDWDDDAPSWLKHALHTKQDLKKVVMAPIAVCTTDFLVASGDLTKQGNHALAFLRIASSDLILDEIDSYDSTALVAVMRMVMLAALCGRNVVASSATLTEECAKALWIGWKRGIAMRQALLDSTKKTTTLNVKVLMLDHLQPPVVLPYLSPSASREESHKNFEKTYRYFLATMMSKIEKSEIHRKAVIIDIEKMKKDEMGRPIPDEKNRQAFYEAILDQAKKFHSVHKFSLLDKKTISFGLIRVSNINVAIPLANYIAETTKNWSGPKVKVCCYHSRTTRLRRFFLEKRLDTLLHRSKKDASALFTDEGLKKDIGSDKNDIMFIVVATPVEEIGRDHDFDYGIAEPSSTQSLIQMPGRINRHRQQPVETANFAILNYNMRSIVPNNSESHKKNYFYHPGLDDDPENPFVGKSNDLLNVSMEYLLKRRVGDEWPLDARLKFERDNQSKLSRPFAALESEALQRRLKPVFEIFENPLYQAHFLQTGLYRFFVLREKVNGEKEHTIEFNNTEQRPGSREVVDHVYQKADETNKQNFVTISQSAKLPNDWLVLDDDEAQKLAQDMGLSGHEALSVTLMLRTKPGQTITDCIKWNQSFGMEII